MSGEDEAHLLGISKEMLNHIEEHRKLNLLEFPKRKILSLWNGRQWVTINREDLPVGTYMVRVEER